MTKMLMGAFEDQAHANMALQELEERGYTPEEISVISKSNEYKDQGYSTGETVAKSAGTGAATGGAVGGLAGLLAGAGIIPAVAGLFIGGPIAAALGLAGIAATTASGAVTGAAAGGLIGALTGLGLSKETAASYDETVNKGGIVIGLMGHDEITGESRMVMEKHGARNISAVDMRQETTDETMDDEAMDRGPAMRQEPAFGERRDIPREK